MAATTNTARYQVKSVTMTFGDTTYEVPQAPAGQPQTSDPTDVSCLNDTAKKFIKGAITNNDSFDVVAQGLTASPTINTVAALSFTAAFNNGSTDTTVPVSVGNCILTGVQPPNPEAGGDRAANWTLTFQPGAVVPAT